MKTTRWQDFKVGYWPELRDKLFLAIFILSSGSLNVLLTTNQILYVYAAGMVGLGLFGAWDLEIKRKEKHAKRKV